MKWFFTRVTGVRRISRREIQIRIRLGYLNALIRRFGWSRRKRAKASWRLSQSDAKRDKPKITLPRLKFMDDE